MTLSDTFNGSLTTAITEREMVKVRMACLDFLADARHGFSITEETMVPLAEKIFAFIKGDDTHHDQQERS